MLKAMKNKLRKLKTTNESKANNDLAIIERAEVPEKSIVIDDEPTTSDDELTTTNDSIYCAQDWTSKQLSHNAALAVVELSGGVLVSGHEDGSINLWNLGTKESTKTLTAHTEAVCALVALNKDRIISSGKDKTIKIWDIARGKCIKTLKGHDGAVCTLAILSNGYLASGSEDKTIMLWDIKSGKCVKKLERHEGAVVQILALSDGTFISGSKDNHIGHWTSEGDYIERISRILGDTTALALSPEGKIISGGHFPSISVWDVQTQFESCSLSLDITVFTETKQLAMLPDGVLVACGGFIGYGIMLWDLKEEKCLKTIKDTFGGCPTAFLVLANGNIVFATERGLFFYEFSKDILQLMATKVANNSNKNLSNEVKIPTPAIEASNENSNSPLSNSNHDVADEPALLKKQSFNIENYHAGWGIRKLVILPDGVLASSSVHADIICWDSQTGQFLRKFRDGTASINALIVLTDGTLASGAQADNFTLIGHYSEKKQAHIKLWNPKQGKCLQTIGSHNDDICSLVELDDGNLASGSKDTTIKIWNRKTGNCLKTLIGHNWTVNALAVIAKKTLASASGDSTIKIWDLATGQCLRTLNDHDGSTHILLTLADGTLISGGGKTIKRWNPHTGQCLQTLTGHTDNILALTALADGFLASGSDDKTIKLWDLKTERCLKTLTGHEDSVTALAAFANGTLASGSRDSTLQLHTFLLPEAQQSHTAISDTANSAKPVSSEIMKATHENSNNPLSNPNHNVADGPALLNEQSFNIKNYHAGWGVRKLVILPDGVLASSSVHADIICWDSQTGLYLRTLSDSTASITASVNALIVLTDGTLASAADATNFTLEGHNLQKKEAHIKLWNPKQGKCLQTLRGHNEDIHSLVELDDGNLASGSKDTTIKIWDRKTGNCLKTFSGHSWAVSALAVVAKKTLASASWDSTIKIWDLETGQCLRTLNDHDGSTHILLTLADGTLISGGGKTIKRWNPHTGQCLQTLTGHTDKILALTALADGFLASGSDDKTIKLWDLKTGQCLKTLTGHADSVTALAAFANGTLVSGSRDSTLQLHTFLLPEAQQSHTAISDTANNSKPAPSEGKSELIPTTPMADKRKKKKKKQRQQQQPLQASISTSENLNQLISVSQKLQALLSQINSLGSPIASPDKDYIENVTKFIDEKLGYYKQNPALLTDEVNSENLQKLHENEQYLTQLASKLSSAAMKVEANTQPSTPQTTIAETYCALYDYTRAQKEELSFRAGDVLTVIDKKEDGWWSCEYKGEIGIVPSNYLKKYTDSPVSIKKSLPPIPQNASVNVLDNKMHLQISFSIAHTELNFGNKLGEGGFGVVYKGVYCFNEVAIKQLKSSQLSSEVTEEFKQEMVIMAQLRSPNIVQLYGVCTDKTPYCLVMEYLPKGSLYTVLHSQAPLSWEQRETIAFDIAKGLAYLHSQKILHRDLKSLNVLLDVNLHAKLTDFGLARLKTESKSTQTNQRVGSLPWMAPELFGRRAKYTEKADMYSYGMTVWEITSRQIPFADAHDPSVIPSWVSKGEREEISTETPPKLAKLIRFCWEAAPEKRPSASEAIQQLQSESASLSTSSLTSSGYIDNAASESTYLSPSYTLSQQ